MKVSECVVSNLLQCLEVNNDDELRERLLKKERGGLREEGEEVTLGVSQLLLTVLVPPALRKDTQWLPLQLHLALLILQFSPGERRGRVGCKGAG